MRTRFGLLQMLLLVALAMIPMGLLTELNRRWGLQFSDHVPLTISQDGSLVAAGVSTLPIQVWDTKTNRRVAFLKGHTGYVQGLGFIGDKQLVSGSWDGTIRFWDAPARNEIRQINPGKGLIQSLEASSDGKLIATANGDPIVRLWDAESGNEIASLDGHTSIVRRLTFSPNGKWLGSVGENEQVRVWDTTNQKLVFAKPNRKGTSHFSDIAISSAGTIAIAFHNKAKLELYDLESGQALGELHGPEKNNYSSVAFSPNGKTVAVGHSGRISIHDVESRRRLRTFESDEGWVDSLVFANDGEELYSGCYHNRILKWDVATGTRLAVLQRKWDGVQWDLIVYTTISFGVWLTLWRFASSRRELDFDASEVSTAVATSR